MIIKAICAIIVCCCAIIEVVLVGLIIYDNKKKRVQMSATVRPETRDTIKDYCKAKQTRLGRLLDTMVKQGIFNKKD